MANLLEEASILITPTAYSEGKIHAVKPSRAPFADLDFTRGSSATRINEQGLIENSQGANVPRLDYSDGEASFLFEPQVTNLVKFSNTGFIIDPPQSTSLIEDCQGRNTALLIVPKNHADRFDYVIPQNSFIDNQKLTYSWYRKRLSTPIISNIVGDLKTKKFLNCVSLEENNATKIGSNVNGYDRFQVVFKIIDSSLDATLRLYYGDIIGIGNSSVAYWGHQLEKGNKATTLIATNGSTVTRLRETASKSGLGNLINSKEGTFFVNMAALSDSLNWRFLSLSNESGTNRLVLAYKDVTKTLIVGYTVNGISVVEFNHTLTNVDEFIKIGFRFKKGDFALILNGNEVATSNNQTMIDIGSLNTFNSSLPNGNLSFEGRLKILSIFKKGLLNSELISLTS